MTEHTDILHFGVIGEKLGHSLSPEIHADLLQQQGIAGTYEKYEMNREEVNQIFDFMKERQITGLNVTIPYKEALFQMVDVLDDHAEQIGAVNTVYLKDGISYGYNTDYIGVTSMLSKAGVDLNGKHIVILGSGGACRALIYGFHLKGAASVTIAARNTAAKQTLKEAFPYIRTCTLQDIPSGDLIINTTPVGMYPNTGKSVVGADVLRRFSVAADIVYNPLNTEFLRIARSEGLQTVTGLMMLVDQAIASEEIWLEKKLDYQIGSRIHDVLAARF
jgi:shikimate dehydrogenase